MNINRNNYETYFLLYVDKELSAEERIAVEKFTEENPDLAAELELLLSATLPDESISYNAKNELYKTAVSPDALKEKMLLHLDNELDLSSISSLETSIATNDALVQEWNILQQTKLDPNEHIVFANKQSLYRKERDNVISIRNWRVAVAAAIIGFGIFIGISVLTKKKETESVATTRDRVKPVQKNTTVPQNNNQDKKINAQQTDNNTIAETNNKKQDAVPVVKDEKLVQQPSTENLASNSIEVNKENKKKIKADENKINEEKNIAQKPTNNLPKPYFENINNDNSNKTVSANVEDNKKAIQNKEEPVDKKVLAMNDLKDPKPVMEDAPLTETHNDYAKNTTVSEPSSETNNNHILLMDEEKINRSKISGLFRKVKRVLARNANVKSGNSIKIAGFEIASK